MAYLKRVTIGSGTYYYIVRSIRSGAKVTPKILEYLGRNPDPKRLKRALEYWQVGTKRKPGKAKRRNR